MPLTVLTWNLKHGRAEPSAGRDLFAEFAAAIAGWPWDVALLQEVPPWWPALLGERLGAEARMVLTSRNAGLALRRAIAVRRPDLIKSNGGGSNAILLRGTHALERRTLRLRRLPERRRLLALRLDSGLWVGTLHATVHNAQAAVAESGAAARAMLAWAGDAPIVLGGDFNVRTLELDGLAHAGGFDVDHVFTRGFTRTEEVEVLERPVLAGGQRLSDHDAVLVRLA